MTGNRESFVVLTTPTSGTGSLGRLIRAITANTHKFVNISDEFIPSGDVDGLKNWSPEPVGYGYLYNTPHIVCESLITSGVRVITNFRDPRDMACNQYYWALQHPDVTGRLSESALESKREKIRSAGIDAFVQNVDNSIHFRMFEAMADRLVRPSRDVLNLSYAQLCLDFDSLVSDLLGFFEVEMDGDLAASIESERPERIDNNPSWIGNHWTGGDVSPGRYRKELSCETIQKFNDRHASVFGLMRKLERKDFRSLLTLDLPGQQEVDKALVGSDGFLFLDLDSNSTQKQIRGEFNVPDEFMAEIAKIHWSRSEVCLHSVGAIYKHLVVPSKEVVLRSLLPAADDFESMGPRPISKYISSSYAKVWEPFYNIEVLSGSSDRPLYSRQDTHWTHDGAIRYFSWFQVEADIKSDRLLQSIPVLRTLSNQVGDLGGKLFYDPEDVDFLAPSRKSASLAFFNKVANTGSVRYYTNPISSGRCLIFHDSFASWLYEFIPEIFAEVIFVHANIFDFDFLKKYSPDFVFYIQAERFFVSSPRNSVDIFDFVSEMEVSKGGGGFAEYFSRF
ncbi:MAG: hypothetical protein REI09_10380 [Candidatus Dactylopiibacterium sp.]|nr:hypothetical protein [Candidatus Dactylopiibacterium sp.]